MRISMADRIANILIALVLMLVVAAVVKGCNTKDEPTPEDTKKQEQARLTNREKTLNYLKWCELECPSSTKAFVVKGGTGQYGNEWTCGCAMQTYAPGK